MTAEHLRWLLIGVTIGITLGILLSHILDIELER